MTMLPLFAPVVLLFFFSLPLLVSSQDGPLYDHYASTECKPHPDPPLYGGGMLKDQAPSYQLVVMEHGDRANASAFQLSNLYLGTKYTFSAWVTTNNDGPALIKARVETDTKEEVTGCIGTVIARQGCWSFLKGGFVLYKGNSNSSTIYIQYQTRDGRDISIEVASASLQPFTEEQWRFNQDLKTNETRRRAVIIHVTDRNGKAVQGAAVRVELALRAFPLGAAIANTIIGNMQAQKWFADRFNVAVFEDQLKWYATEIVEGQVDYSIPDKMLEFTRANQIMVRGHNVVWTAYGGPDWSKNLTGASLQSSVDKRIESLMNHYKGEFVHWDVNNEVLHNPFYEERLGPDATLQIYKKVQQADPLAGLFMNEYNVVEQCFDDMSNVDTYINKLKEFEKGGITRQGVGLQSHFGWPNPPLMRGVLDKFATLGYPIWLTEVDISRIFTKDIQALYLEEVLREAYSHPAVDGILLWTAIREGDCYKMCLTDLNYTNLATGDMVDKLIEEWDTEVAQGQTDDHGSFSFIASLGEYRVSVKSGKRTVQTTLSVPRSKDTLHFNIQI